MSYSQSQSSDQDLVYDNAAFSHFMVSISVLVVIILVIMIINQIWGRRKPYLYYKLEKEDVFKEKVVNSQKFDKLIRSNKSIRIKIILLIVSMLTFYFYFRSLELGQQLVRFDPYQILNLDFGANQSQIKKSYRKLALQFHPDRRISDPQAYKKFILITKAYKCLTDQQTKINCQKYGHPDGEQSYKIGIGLPSFIISGGRGSISTLIILLALLIVIIPWVFFKWISSTKTKSPEIKQTNRIIHSLMNPKLNTVSCCIIYGCMKELNYLFQQKEILAQQLQKQFRNFLLKESNIEQKILSKITPHQLFKIRCIYDYIKKNNNDFRIVYQIPQICQKLLKFSFLFGRRLRNASQLFDEVDHKQHQWYGLILTKRIITFSQQVFNRIPDIHFQNRSFSKQKELPNISLSGSITVQDKQVLEVTVDDVAYLHVKIKKQKNSSGQVVCNQHPFIVQQKFILLIYQNSNLLSALIFKFQQQKSQILHQLRLKKIKKGHSNISMSLYSMCYPQILLQRQLNLYVYQRIEKRPIKINQLDKKIDNIPKNFFQKLITIYDDSLSDMQLSESQGQVQQIQLKKRKAKKLLKGQKNQQRKFKNLKKKTKISKLDIDLNNDQ